MKKASAGESISTVQAAAALGMSSIDLRLLLFQHSRPVIGGAQEAFVYFGLSDGLGDGGTRWPLARPNYTIEGGKVSGEFPTTLYGVLGRKVRGRWKVWLVGPWVQTKPGHVR